MLERPKTQKNYVKISKIRLKEVIFTVLCSKARIVLRFLIILRIRACVFAPFRNSGSMMQRLSLDNILVKNSKTDFFQDLMSTRKITVIHRLFSSSCMQRAAQPLAATMGSFGPMNGLFGLSFVFQILCNITFLGEIFW